MKTVNRNMLTGPVGAAVMLILFMSSAHGQAESVHGNSEIDAAVGAQTAIATGASNTAKNRVGVVYGSAESTTINAVVGDQTTVATGVGNKAQSNIGVATNTGGGTHINAAVGNATTIVAGVRNSAKTNIGVVKDRSNAKVVVGVGSVVNVVGGTGRKGCINIGTKGVDSCN